MTRDRLIFLSLITTYFVVDFIAVILTKRWIDKGERSGLVVAMVLYNVCSICWCLGLKHETVGRAAMVYTLFAALCGVICGFVWFKEKLTTTTVAGIVLAFVALILLQVGEDRS